MSKQINEIPKGHTQQYFKASPISFLFNDYCLGIFLGKYET